MIILPSVFDEMNNTAAWLQLPPGRFYSMLITWASDNVERLLPRIAWSCQRINIRSRADLQDYWVNLRPYIFEKLLNLYNQATGNRFVEIEHPDTPMFQYCRRMDLRQSAVIHGIWEAWKTWHPMLVKTEGFSKSTRLGRKQH